MYRGTNYKFFSGSKHAHSDDYYANLNTAVVLGRSKVPLKHKQLGANYLLIRRIFGNCVASIPITSADKNTLARHGFNQLENTTISQMNRQIEQLKNWANSGDILLSAYANELFEIRIKELKYMRSTISLSRMKEFEEGYKALEKYIDYIAN